jgi:hypothetical protein
MSERATSLTNTIPVNHCKDFLIEILYMGINLMTEISNLMYFNFSKLDCNINFAQKRLNCIKGWI